MQQQRPFYPEIQGIRALSIAAVILFHFGSRNLPGGYVGVDMFFVISGYIITKMIVEEIRLGAFSIRRFYRNRVVRLLPNLFLMIAASVAISYFVLKPYDFFQYAKSLQFSAIYVTNMVFARQQGYFDMSRDAKPLLHTWSLSIEEQFYLIFPMFLILLFRFERHRFKILALIAAASFAVRLGHFIDNQPIEGFFSFAGRIWEFVIGASIVFIPESLKNRLHGNEAISLFALILALGSLVFLDEGIPGSALLVAIPCAATAALITSSRDTKVCGWLASDAFVFIGGISYSLYLWHWPVIVWFHNADWELSDSQKILGMTVLTATLAFFAWKYVEEPFRKNREKFSGKSVGIAVLSFGFFCVATGSYIYNQKGIPERFPQWVAVQKNLEAYDFSKATGTAFAYPPNCSINDNPDSVIENCAFGDRSAKKTILVLGDSHALAWYPAFQSAFEKSHVRGVLAGLPGCPPVFGIQSWDGAKDICARGFDRDIGALIGTGKFEKVYLVALWSLYSDGRPGDQPNHFISDEETTAHDAEESRRVLDRRFSETITRMKESGIAPVIVRSVPVLPKPVQELPDGFTQPLDVALKQHGFIDGFIARNRIESIDPTPILCPEGLCRTRIDGNYIYTDNNHISPAGAARLVGLIESNH